MTLYLCNHNKNIECEKNRCKYESTYGECFLTSKKEYAQIDESGNYARWEELSMTIDEAIEKLNGVEQLVEEDEYLVIREGRAFEALKIAKKYLEAWQKTESELKKYAVKLATESEYDIRTDAVLYCLNTMKKNLKQEELDDYIDLTQQAILEQHNRKEV